MSSRCPYTYPHRSKAAQIEYLEAHQSRYTNQTDPGWCPLVWNVKLYDVDTTGLKGDYEVRRWLDERWEQHVKDDTDGDLWNGIIEDMCRPYTDDEYTTCPGNDQGHWSFFFFGRSSGWMGLEKWKDDHIFKSFGSAGDWHDYLFGLPTKELKTLYRAVICMDADFTTQKIHVNFACHMNWSRYQWEETLHIDPLIDAMRTALWKRDQKEKIRLERKAKGVACEVR